MMTTHEDGATVAQTPLVFVDLETTGLDANAEEILEIGAMRIEAGQERGIVETFVRPTRPIPASAARIHGISDLMVATAPPLEQAIEPLLALLQGSILVAHNAPFDCGFLAVGLQRLGRPLPECGVLDTVALARGLFPRMPNHKLETLCRHFEVTVQRAHRALDDVRSLASVFDHMMKVGYAGAGGTPPMAEVFARCGTRFVFSDFGTGIALPRAEDRALLRWAQRTGAPLRITWPPQPGARGRETALAITGLVDGPDGVVHAKDAAGTPVDVRVKSILQIKRA